jgi:hypothetical protein
MTTTIKRVLQIVFGAAIAFCLLASYSDKTHQSQLLIWYVLTPEILKVIAWLFLFFIAGRLIFGKFKDTSKYFYQLMIDIFGDAKRTSK